MAIYDFRHIPRTTVLHSTGTVKTKVPNLGKEAITGRAQTSKRPRLYNTMNVNFQEETVHQLIPGIHHIDLGIKNYFSDVRVPTDDSMRTTPVPIRIAGGDKTTLYWKQLLRDDLRNGRIKLPVMALNRESFEYNPQKYSPPHVPIGKEFADTDGTRMRLIPRPYPIIVNYTLGLWAERKRDIEYMMYQIVPRFHGGLAEILVDAGLITGAVIMKFNNFTDTSDIEAEADSLAKVQYDITISAEAWMPLPERVVPTVLGHVATLREYDTNEFLEVARIGTAAIPIGQDSVARPT